MALLAVIAISSAGAVQPGPLPWRPSVSLVPPPPQPTQPPGWLGTQPKTGEPSPVVGIVLQVLALVAVVVLLVVLVRRLLIAWRRRRRRVLGTKGEVRIPAGTALVAAEVTAPVVRRGIDRALVVLGDGDRAPADAVVAAWIGLEETAVQGGLVRDASETAAEYAVRILSQFVSDAGAMRTLLRIYEDVRFGGRPADADTVDAARECLLSLRRSWHDTPDAAGSGRSPGRTGVSPS